MSTPIRVTVRCFSHARHVLGRDVFEFEFAPGSTTDDVLARVRAMAGGRLDALPMRVARNRSYVLGVERLQDGDEIALIPPVQGG